MHDEMIRILLVDDHAMLRQGIRAHLRTCRDIRIADEAGSGKEMMTLLRRKPYDVIVLDIKLSDGSGLTMLRKIRALRPSTRIVILTMYDSTQYASHALEHGVKGYVVKGAAVDELTAAIRAVHAGKVFVSPSIKRRMARWVKDVRRQDQLDRLSPREYEVLKSLANGQTLKEVAANLGVSTKTITTYRTRLLDKLNLSTNADIVRIAIRAQLVD
jgi:DNA-binding NarL/FixJ family response regulator